MKKTVKLLVVATFLALFALPLNAFAVDDVDRLRELTQEYEQIPQNMEQAISLNNGGNVSIDGFSGRYYDKLSADCKKIYDAIDLTIRNVIDGDDSLYIRDDNLYYSVFAFEPEAVTKDNYSDCVSVSLSAYMNDHPRESSTFDGYMYNYPWEYYEFMDERMSDIDVISDGNRLGVVSLDIFVLDEHVVERVNRLDEAVDMFCTQYHSSGMESQSDLEKYRYIHDYLCRSCKYNDDAVMHVEHGQDGFEAYITAHNAYGALVELEYGTGAGCGNVVCEGYAEAFLLLCQRLNIPCATVDGDGGMAGAELENNHEWNVVQLNGSWYAVDVTWDDQMIPVSDSSGQRVAEIYGWNYDYFADNRYFVQHEGEPEQNHAAMTQMKYLTNGDTFSLDAPVLTGIYIEDVADWSVPEYRILLRGDAQASNLNRSRAIANAWYPKVTRSYIDLCGDLFFDETVTISDGEYCTIRGNLHPPYKLIRNVTFADTMLNVEAGGMLDLFGVELNGNHVMANAPMLNLGAGSDKRAVVELFGSVVTGSRGTYAIIAEDNAKAYFSVSVDFSDNYIDEAGETEANVFLADSASFHLDYWWDNGGVITHNTNDYAGIGDDSSGIHVSVLCLEKDAVLLCAAYDEAGRMVRVAAREIAEGYHSYDFDEFAEDYGRYDNMSAFMLKDGTVAPLAQRA